MSDLPPLTTETLWAILNDSIDDHTVNRLIWDGLGYRYSEEGDRWDSSRVVSEWRDQYPEPPNFIENRPAIVKLTRSIPKENKQLLKTVLGFEGYKISELTPDRTRRATAVNWLLSQMKETGLLT
jgi:hypothetical protein